MKRFLILLAAMLIGAAAWAQNNQTTVRGTVLDGETREGEIGAIIQFFAPGSEKPVAFASADAEGHFSLNLSGEGEYRVLVTNMGRKDISRNFTLGGDSRTLDLGEFLMESDAKALDAATVVDRKTLVKMEVDKMSYAVSEDIDSKASTVLEMLRKVPMVTVDGQDKITVNGSSSFLVTVDGKPNHMLTQNASVAFKMMPASSVESIEVITNPGVKYDAEGVGGVLNLVTARVSGGSGSSSSLGDGQYGSVRLVGGNQQSAAGGMLTMQRGKFSFSVNGDAGYMLQKGEEVDTRITTPLGGTRTLTNTDLIAPMVMGDASLSYEPDSLNLLTASAGVMYLGVNQKSDLAHYLVGMADPLYRGSATDRSPRPDLNASVDWQHRFAGHPGRMLTFSYRLSDSPASVSSENTYEPAAAMPARKMDGRTVSNDHTFQGDFTSPLGEKAGSLSTGVKFTFRKNTSDQDLYLMTAPSTEYVYNNEGSTNYHYYNRIAAGYAEWSGSFGKWGFKAGGRYEYTWQNVNWKQGAGEDFSARYGVFVPTASIQYSLGAMQNVGLSYNIRIARPGIGYLNPYVNKNDPTHWSFGNTALDVEKSHNLSLVYNYYTQKFMMNLTLRHSRTGNGISEYSYTEDGIIKTTYLNNLRQEASGATAFVNYNISPKARIYANLGATYTDARSTTQKNYAYGAWNWELFAGAQQTLPWDLQLSEGVVGQSKSYNLQGWMSGFSAGFLTLSKSFLDDRLTLSAQAVSHFSTDKKVKLEMLSRGEGYESLTVARIPIRQVVFSLSWTFGSAGVSVKKTDRTIEKDDILDKSSGRDSMTGGVSGVGM